MNITKTISLILIALGIAFSSYLSGLMYFGEGEFGEVLGGTIFLVSALILIACFIAVLFNKGSSFLEKNNHDGLSLG